MNLIKKVASLGYKKEVLPIQILKECKKILVIFPTNEFEINYLLQAIKLLAKKFKSASIVGVINENMADTIKNKNIFSDIIEYKKIPRLYSRQFFTLKKKLRTFNASVSIDFNTRNDVLTWLAGATLRIGTQSSPFINYRIKIDMEKKNSPIRLINSICIQD